MSRTAVVHGRVIKARDIKAGQVILADGLYYKAWRLVRVERENCVVLLASRRDHAGDWEPDAVGLLLNNDGVGLRAVSL